MSEQEFLEKVSYLTNTVKEKLIVWYDSKILAELDFSETPEKLNDDDYCTDIAEQVALESSYGSLITED